MTRRFLFNLPNGRTMGMVLQWKYVPYYEELRDWFLNNWDEQQEEEYRKRQRARGLEEDMIGISKEAIRRFYEAADRLVEAGTKPKHPIGWALDKVQEFLDEED